MMLPLLGRLLGPRPIPRRPLRAAFDLVWHHGYAWGFTEGCLCSLTLALVVLVLVLAIRSRSRHA